MKKLLYILLFLSVGLHLSAQSRTIIGQVFDGESSNEPIAGAIISLQKSDKTIVSGTMTDDKGLFSITVNDDIKTLVVSFMGYATQHIAIKGDNNKYTIVLQLLSNEMDEVVVTGYQKIERRKLTAAVSSIDISEEKVGAVKNIDQALAGQVAGLSAVSSSGAPGAPVKIRIRGTASINGTQDPLWVLDGIPLEGTDIPSMEDLKDIDEIYQTSIAGLNPADIENITVLKDAAATAIYGARAANGVIVITTRKGKAGKAQINFSAKLTCNPKTDISRLNLLNSAEKVDLELGLLSQNYSYREHKGYVSSILSSMGQLDTYKTGGWETLPPDAQAAINNLRATETDWNDILFRPVVNQEYYLSLSGGTDKASYYTSLGYYDEQGNVKGVDNNRFNITLKTDYQINKYLSVGASIFANQRKQNSYLTDYNGFTNPVYYSRLANPYMQPYDENGNYIYDTNVQGKETSSLAFNIFEERENTSNRRTDRSFMAVFDAALRATDYLKFTTQAGLQLDGYTLDRYAGENSYAMRKEKLFAEYLVDGEKKTILPDGGMHKVNENHTFQWTWKAMAEYSQRFRKIHAVEAMAGMELRHIEAETLYTAAYGYDPRTLTTQPIIFPSENIAESYPLHQETFTENAYVSWFATASYSLKDRYTVGGSIRFDGSDVFGVAKKYRYLPLYSVSALWRIKEESFLRDVEAIDNLAVRASYGLQGNIDKQTSPYLIGILDKTTILPGNIEDEIETETAPNPSLRWEKTQNVNVGFDFSVLDRAINLTVDYYYRRSTDLIGMKMLPLETGFSSTTINWASMTNKGVEIALATRNIYTKSFTWTTNINIGINQNKVLQETVAENATYPSRQGYPVGAIFAYKTAGLDEEGYPLYLTADGQAVSATEFFKLNSAGASTLTAEEQRNLYTYMGTTDPKISGGFINNFEWRNWQLGINLVFNFGMKVRVTPSYNPTTYDRGLNTNRDILDAWSPTNTGGKFPRLMNAGTRAPEYVQYSEYNLYSMLDMWVKKSNYMRCQSIRLGYKFEGKWLEKLRVKSASLSLEGRNLFVISSNYDNFLDPETMGNPYAQPIPKSIIFGVNVNF